MSIRARDIPNIITVLRIFLALPLLWALLQKNWMLAFVVVIVAGLSDALDGYLAKRYDWGSELGGILDPIADKVMLIICFFGLWWSARFPSWLLALIVLRDVVIVSGATAWWRLHNRRFHAKPSMISKITTTLQIALGVFFLAALAFSWQLSLVLQVLMLAVALFTLVSGLDYVWRYGRAARSISKEK